MHSHYGNGGIFYIVLEYNILYRIEYFTQNITLYTEYNILYKYITFIQKTITYKMFECKLQYRYKNLTVSEIVYC